MKKGLASPEGKTRPMILARAILPSFPLGKALGQPRT